MIFKGFVQNPLQLFWHTKFCSKVILLSLKKTILYLQDLFRKYLIFLGQFSRIHIPVHADIHELDVIFVEEQDYFVNDLGVKRIGEIGIVGIPLETHK